MALDPGAEARSSAPREVPGSALPAATPAPGVRHLPALDGVRGIAVLLVMMTHFVHSSAGSKALSDLERFVHCGWRGVDLFFVLSGYLITSRLRVAPAENYFRNFYARRVLRIFPLYYLAITVAFLSVPFLSPQDASRLVGASHPIWYYLYVPNLSMAYVGGWLKGPHWFGLGHFWSLAIEEQFYLAWPLVTRWAPRAFLPLVCLVVGAESMALEQELWDRKLFHEAYVLTPARLSGLAFGAFLASIDRELPRARLALPASVLFHGLLLATAWAVYSNELVFPDLERLVLATCVATVWAASLEVDGRPAVSWLANPVLRWFGAYSYGLYVYHQLLEPVWRRLFAPVRLIESCGRGLGALSYALLAGACTCALAWVSWHAFEKRLLRLKVRYGG